MNKPEALNCLPIGTRLAEFEIRDVIGEGGFGIVYLAFDHSLQRTVAVKEYMPSALAARSGDQTVAVRSKRHAEAFGAGLRSFINEARLLAQFDHPALVKVYRFWESHGTAYMAMRYYEGRTFKAVCRDNPELVDEAWLKRLLKPILGALETLYAAHILHRDISPENIMIQPSGEAVLLDFGAARQIVSDLAQSLTVILKPGFAPVEQYADDESMRQGPWTDIYSLSAVMYSAIAGKAPPAAVARMLNDPIEPLALGSYPRFGKQFLEAIDRGMAVRPEVRPQSIAEFASLLGVDLAAGTAQAEAASPADSRAATPPAGGEGKPSVVAQGREAAPAASRAAAKPAAAGQGKPAAAKAAGKQAARTSGQAAAPAARGKPAGGAHAARSKLAGGALAVLALAIGGGAWFASGSGSNAQHAPAPAASVPSADVVASSASAQASLQTVPAASAASAAPAVAMAASAPAEAPAAGTLAIAVQPWATIYVDGVQKGVTPPLKKLTLSPGVHEVRLENPNYPAFVQKVTVDSKKPVTIRHDFGT